MRMVEQQTHNADMSKWFTKKYDLESTVDMARYIARVRYAFPGGYELLATTNDGGLLCSGCVRDNYRTIHHSTKHSSGDGWQVSGISTDAEVEDDCCVHCNKQIGYQSD